MNGINQTSRRHLFLLIVLLMCCILFTMSEMLHAQNPLPFLEPNLDPEWKIFYTDDPSRFQELDKISPDEDELTCKDGSKIKAIKVTPVNHGFDVNQVLGKTMKPGTVAIAVNRLYAPYDGIVRIGAGADWWMTCYINGAQVYTSEPDGNPDYPIHNLNVEFEAQLKKGENPVVLKLRSGAMSWNVSFGPQVKVPQELTDRELLRILRPAKQALLCPSFLLDPAQDAVSICFALKKPAAAGIRYKEQGSNHWTELWDLVSGQKRTDTFFRYRLNHLKGGTEYVYQVMWLDRVKGEMDYGPERQFTAGTGDSGSPFSIFALGDIQFPPPKTHGIHQKTVCEQ